MFENWDGKSVAIAATGGIDSIVLAYMYCDSRYEALVGKKQDREPVVLLGCNYGQKTFERNCECIEYHCVKLQERYGAVLHIYPILLTVQLPVWSTRGGLFKEGYQPAKNDDRDFIRQEKPYQDELVDGRNAFIHLWMLSWCSQDHIPVLLTGYRFDHDEWNNLDSYKMRSSDIGAMFLDRMNLLQEVGFQNRVRIEAPFSTLRMDKQAVIELGADLGVNLNETYSCQFYPKCGHCANCVKLAGYEIHQKNRKEDEKPSC